ncbi:MAG: hypothetical protein KAW88_05140, partial [Candidatus Cloacimonetes bacterium]|nr:hypothetical protein [Candidatus Cloacimonadota bacterium]
ESNYYTEAAYRLGTVYFEIALDARIPKPYYDKAIYYFNEVAKRENDPLEYHGLFQRGWTYFTSANFEKAIEDFSDILEVILIDTLKIMKIYFEADAIENMAFSLIEYDGTDFEQASIAATKAKEIFLNFVNEDYGKEVIQKSIKLKHKYNAPMQAVDLYNAYIWLYPTALECPNFIDSVMTIFKRNPSRTREGVPAEELVIDEYKKLITDYRVDSLWFQTNAEKDLTNQLRVIREAYEFMEPKYYNIFVQSKLENDYLIYKELVENYCQYDAFKDEVSMKKMESMHKGLVDLSQDLAEISQDPRFYFATIDNISTFMESYPDHPALVEYKETEFYNYEKIYNMLKPIIKEQVYIDTINNINLDKDALDSLFVQATLSYEDFLSQRIESGKVKESELIRIVYQRAELEYDREEYEAAFEDFKRLLNYNPDNEIKKVTYSRLAEISQDRSDYTQAEGYYREATKYATDEEKQAFNNNILATMQAKANTLSDSADYVTAAQEYLRLSRELEKDDEEQSIQFIVKAIKSYESTGEYQTAIDLYLDIASRKEDKNDILTAYIKAWTISDSLLDWQQSESLRKQFINKFKDSNEAYKLRLQIIAYYEGEQFNDKEKAAEMYLELHNDADNIDIGEDNKESIFLNAFRIYQELDNENKIVDLSLEFEKLYPNHSKANDFLIIVAKIYKDRSEEEKFEELAAYLYKKDPTIDLLVTVAAAKLKEIKTEVDSLFDSKQYDLMYDQIAKFKKAEEHYQAEGLQLPTEAIYEAFDYYDNYIAYHDQYLDRLRKGEIDFLDKSPDELIRVNELTEWKRHLVEGKKRIAKVMEKCDEIKAEIIALIQEGNKYALKTEDRTRALYTAGKVYDYGAYVVKQQIQKYVDISNQLNNEQMQANPVQQTQFKTAILAEANKHRVSFLKKSVQLYN